MKTEKRKITALPILVILAAVLLGTILLLDKPQPEPEAEQPETVQTTEPTEDPYAFAHTPVDRLVVFARLNGLSLEEDWPEYMLELIQKNPDAEEYVRNYPLLKDTPQTIDLSDCVGTGQVPRLYQWDTRWGYTKYGDKPMGLTGCGPTCLSMVCLYYLGDAKYTPRYVADYAKKNGHYTLGVGTEWSLMSKGAKDLGLNVVTIPANAQRIMDNLKVGNLVILAMGPGDFTDSGHFILLTGVQDGKAIVHDPNSVTNSEQLWKVSSIRKQIQNVWVFQPIEE